MQKKLRIELNQHDESVSASGHWGGRHTDWAVWVLRAAVLPLTHACVPKGHGRYRMAHSVVVYLLLVLRGGPCSPAVNSPVGADTAVFRHKSPASNTTEVAERAIMSLCMMNNDVHANGRPSWQNLHNWGSPMDPVGRANDDPDHNSGQLTTTSYRKSIGLQHNQLQRAFRQRFGVLVFKFN